jgi:fructosamine-3-kinase
MTPLSGGCVGDVQRAELPDGTRVVVKSDPSGEAGLPVEAAMLRDLAKAGAVPVPAVLHADPHLLVLEWLPGSPGCRGRAAEHLGELIAALHGVTADRHGYPYDTRIGGLFQPNAQRASWLAFFAEQRLVYMASTARDAGRLPESQCRAVERVAGRLERWLAEPEAPALLHGDLWSGNVLSSADRITGLIDPAVHYGHPEVELAFTTLFGSFGDGFHDRYRELRGGPDSGFWDERRHLYNLYPLLVHVRLFGGSYVDDVRRVLARFG